MLFTSQYILTKMADLRTIKNDDALSAEKVIDSEKFTIYPWVHNACNQRSSENSCRPVKFPDVSPAKSGHLMAMYAGDFLEIFDEKSKYPAVCTCFFVDTARNIIDYIEHIYHILKPGGVWVNNGPLLYHFSDIKVGKKEHHHYGHATPSSTKQGEFYKTTGSVEFTLSEVHRLIEAVGFKFIENTPSEIANVDYDNDKESLANYQYKTSFWVAVKE